MHLLPAGADTLHIVPQSDPEGVDEDEGGGEAVGDEHFEPEMLTEW